MYKNTPRETGFVPLRAPNSVAGANPGEFPKPKNLLTAVAVADFCKPLYLDKRQPPEQDIAAFANCPVGGVDYFYAKTWVNQAIPGLSSLRSDPVWIASS